MKIEMMLNTEVDKTIFNTIVMFSKRYHEVENTYPIRAAFNDYIDMLHDSGRITDNQHEFLELWFVWDSMENDSGA